MVGLRRANLIFAILAALAPFAHVLELPNKLVLSGSLWLAVQQHLYRGWGPFLGAPAEIGALILTSVLLGLRLRRQSSQTANLTLMAAVAYAGMIATFFIFNNPVNQAVNGWTAATLPPNWADYRLRWEAGHALAAVLSLVGAVALARCWLIERGAEKAAR